MVFYTNGSNVENSTYGSQTEASGMDGEIHPGGTFDLWRKIAAQDSSFGKPDKFCMDPEDSNWVSATVNTLDEKILPYIKNICKRDPLSGKVVTGGIVTVTDSSWLLSWTINRQPQYRNQPKGQVLVWLYGMFSDKPGDFVKKSMRECTGQEICEEWLYHFLGLFLPAFKRKSRVSPLLRENVDVPKEIFRKAPYPVVVLVGDRDMIKRKHSMAIAKLFPKGKFLERKGQGHNIPKKDSAYFNRLIEKMVQDIQP